MDNNRLFDNIKFGDSTEYEIGCIYDIEFKNYRLKDFNTDDNVFPFDDYYENVFIKGLKSYLSKKLNKHEHEIDTEILYDSVLKMYKSKGIVMERSTRNWLKRNIVPSKDQKYKKNGYDLCFALDMDEKETYEFMSKYFQILPFYFKNRTDAIYYYCILNKKSYDTVRLLKEKAQEFDITNQNVDNTWEIGLSINQIDDDETFLSYLKTKCYDEEHQFSTAREKVLELIESNMKLSNNESVYSLLLEIVGFNKYDVGEIDKRYSDFIETFPDDNLLYKIKNNNKVTYVALRKTLILMKFYNYFFHYESEIKDIPTTVTEDEMKERVEEFMDETNDLLYECGFMQLYPRNIFDWHFISFACDKKPTRRLKDFMQSILT